MGDYIEDTESGIYRITPEGRVYSQTKRKIPLVGKGMEFTGKFKETLEPERELTYTLNNRGYYSVGIKRKTYMVHRLVAKAFIPNKDNKSFVNHIDGNKLNNHIGNLEWCTVQENNLHARQTGLHKQAIGHKIKYQNDASKAAALANLKDKSKLSPEQVRFVRQVFLPRSKNYSATALAKQFGISVAAMCKIVSRKTYCDIE